MRADEREVSGLDKQLHGFDTDTRCVETDNKPARPSAGHPWKLSGRLSVRGQL